MPVVPEDDDILVALGTKIRQSTRDRIDKLKGTRFEINISRTIENALAVECDRIEKLIGHVDCDRVSFAGYQLRRDDIEGMIKILSAMSRDLQQTMS